MIYPVNSAIHLWNNRGLNIPTVLFIKLCKPVGEIIKCELKLTEQYLPVTLFIMPYKVVVTFESTGEF